MMDLATAMMQHTSSTNQIQKRQSNKPVNQKTDASFRDILSKAAQAKEKPKEKQSDAVQVQAAPEEAREPIGEQASTEVVESGKTAEISDLKPQATPGNLTLVADLQAGQEKLFQSANVTSAEQGKGVTMGLQGENGPGMNGTTVKDTGMPKALQINAGAQANIREMPMAEAGDVKKTNEPTATLKQASGEQAQSQPNALKSVDAKAQSYSTGEGREESKNTTMENHQVLQGEQVSSGEKLFVKVSEGATIAQPGKLAADVGEKILYQASEGRQEFDIQLSPEDLGKISIKLIFEGGKASVLYHCSNPQTQQALAAVAEQLRSIVETGTGRPTELSQSQGSDQMRQQHSHSDQRGENQARDEQQQRMKQSYYIRDLLPNRNEVTAFMDKLRLGLIQ